MQTSKKHTLLIYLVLLASAAVVIFFSQGSINHYWQQTYHQKSPLQKYLPYPWFTQGEIWQAQLFAFFDPFIPENIALTTLSNPKVMAQPLTQETNSQFSARDVQVKKITPVEQKASVTPAEPPVINKISSDILLHAGDQVFFAGDSLMQGVAPHVQKALRKQYHLKSINLSQQSTGLSYPHFFNWPKTIAETLAKNPNIKALIIFLGPNDPWDIPNPKKPGGRYLKFQSAEWEAVYRSRIEAILQSAKAHHVQVMWLGIPYMRKNKLNTQVRYLDEVIEKTVRDRAIFLPTKQLLSNTDGYQLTIKKEGKVQTVRLKDGIHFSLTGQKILADYVLEHLKYQEN